MKNRSLMALALAASVGACDCDDQLRRALSNEAADERKMAADPKSRPGLQEEEPNDEQGEATTIRVGAQLRPIAGSLDVPEDVDWYRLTAEEDEIVEVSVASFGMLDVALELPVEGGEPLVYDSARRGGAETIPSLGVAGDAVFAVRSVANSTGEYEIRLRRRMTKVNVEAEPNDRTPLATSFSLPGEVEGAYDRAEDRDVYRLRGVPGTPFDLEISPIAGVRQMVRVYTDEALREPMLTLQMGEDVPVRIPNLSVAADRPTYLVLTPLVAGGAPPDGSYRISVAPHAPVEGGILEVEPNDTTAMPLSFDGKEEIVVRGYMHSADDRDRFSLAAEKAEARTTADDGPTTEPSHLLVPFVRDAAPSEPLGARLEWSDRASSFGLRWTTADGDQAEFRREGAEPVARACGLVVDDRPSILEVRAERLGAAPRPGEPQYSLVLTRLGGDGSWEVEPNDSTSRANALTGVARGALAHPDDVDVFAFAVEDDSGAAEARVQLEAHAPSTDLVLRVLDSEGGLVANVDNAPIGSREKTAVDLPTGLYFVEMRWKTGEICVPYRLSLDVGHSGQAK